VAAWAGTSSSALVDVGDEEHRLGGQRRQVAQRVGASSGTGTVRAGRPVQRLDHARSPRLPAIAALSPRGAVRLALQGALGLLEVRRR
jgi:hypothetical protein